MKTIIIYYLIGFVVSLFFIWFYRFSNTNSHRRPKRTDSLGGLIGVWFWPFQIILGFMDIVKWIKKYKNNKTQGIRFKNSFYDSKNAPYSSKYREFRMGDFVENYYGYDIWQYSYNEWDIVKDGVIVGMYAGLNGARRRIDELS